MKSMLSLCTVALMAVSFAASADKVVITGEPVTLIKQGDVYQFEQKDYVVPTDAKYYYVKLDGTNEVCYTEKQTQFATLEPTTIKVSVSGSTVDWVCYPADNTTYFEISR